MGIRHSEEVTRVGGAELEAGEEFGVIAVEITTAGGIVKVLKIRESDASWLMAQLADALAERPAEGKAERFKASVLAGRK
ncbi:hypothetical protein OHA79_09415 [Streptomyces sp. NBC_00841]|uniref:hypothetical protein n=1 Tax=Streptomyces sp. NBC_00841 TaxID=2975847 RepID=UPI002DDB7F61|nr:hypothetical protein [Streptomyces sp. NBC_00841]WRZ98033.1 hypothetical protein OHA79_09415 [Streptomyces sp. NBC_00841]